MKGSLSFHDSKSVVKRMLCGCLRPALLPAVELLLKEKEKEEAYRQHMRQLARRRRADFWEPVGWAGYVLLPISGLIGGFLPNAFV